MADRTFEMELDRMFSQSPTLPDADLFVARVLERLDRGWTFRQLLIGGLGLAGGLIGGAQVIGSGLMGRVMALGAQSDQIVAGRLSALGVDRLLPSGLPIDGEVLWMSAGLAILAAGFAFARLVRDI